VNAFSARRLRKLWYIARRRQRRHADKPKRLTVSIARWLGDALSPVVLMVDDLTNAWHNHLGGSTWEHGGDWGGGLADSRGAVAFLERNLLRDYPEARTTFFVVAGQISAYTRHQPFSHAAPLDATEQSAKFFEGLSRDPRYELAYHGFNHGTPGIQTAAFLQEWRGFGSRQAAILQTQTGLNIFERATGKIPRGGKYGGWDYNKFAEDVVNDCGFDWWCRDWMPRDVTGSVDDDYYDPQLFGSNLVVALPSTVHGHFWDSRQIKVLLQRRQIISIEEHIAPVRPDGMTQTPNIIDDIGELRGLYRYLRSNSVWHATCSDIAAYVAARNQTLVHDIQLDGFSLRYSGRAPRPTLTLRLDCSAVCAPDTPRIAIALPNGDELDPGSYRFDNLCHRHLVTLPVVNGRYSVRPCG
jgi:peptidoglycan/xylan/chitin deacetylase (PgdA/CDA1 family)